MRTRVGLVDDNRLNRNTLAGKIKEFDDIQLVLTAISGDDCLEQIKNQRLENLPQVIFMDLEMPGMDGIQTTRILRSFYPDIFILILTIFDDSEKIFEAIQAGAHGYMLKDETSSGLHQAIKSVIEMGGAPMSPGIARKALQLLSQSPAKFLEKLPEEHWMDSLLTEREKEVLSLTVKGYDAKRIAEILSISFLTVRKHIANVYQKLHVRSRSQLIALGLKNHLDS